VAAPVPVLLLLLLLLLRLMRPRLAAGTLMNLPTRHTKTLTLRGEI
jgi:hypothetical protein